MKKVYFYIIASTLILLVLIGIYLINNRNNKVINNQAILPTPTLIPDISNANIVNTFPTLTQDEVTPLESDRETGDWLRDIYISYPWYNTLPLMTDNYFVYFDVNQKKFIATVYDKSNSEAIKFDVEAQLQNIGVDLGSFEIIWD